MNCIERMKKHAEWCKKDLDFDALLEVSVEDTPYYDDDVGPELWNDDFATIIGLAEDSVKSSEEILELIELVEKVVSVAEKALGRPIKDGDEIEDFVAEAINRGKCPN